MELSKVVQSRARAFGLELLSQLMSWADLMGMILCFMGLVKGCNRSFIRRNINSWLSGCMYDLFVLLGVRGFVGLMFISGYRVNLFIPPFCLFSSGGLVHFASLV